MSHPTVGNTFTIYSAWLGCTPGAFTLIEGKDVVTWRHEVKSNVCFLLLLLHRILGNRWHAHVSCCACSIQPTNVSHWNCYLSFLHMCPSLYKSFKLLTDDRIFTNFQNHGNTLACFARSVIKSRIMISSVFYISMTTVISIRWWVIVSSWGHSCILFYLYQNIVEHLTKCTSKFSSW